MIFCVFSFGLYRLTVEGMLYIENCKQTGAHLHDTSCKLYEVKTN